MTNTTHKITNEALKQVCHRLPNGDALLDRVFSSSHFVAQYCKKHPTILLSFIEQGELQRDFSENEYQTKLKSQLEDAADEAALMKVLRQFRQQALVRIAWRDIVDDATVSQTLAELSWVAECCLQQALALLDTWQKSIWGVPTGRDSKQPQSLVVIGMGKLGGGELNFSSDIDLIFSYPELGETQGGQKKVDNEQYFVRLGQNLIKVIDAITEDGFVYRVDMRLRPFGQQGRLALSFDAMEQYYQAHGRQWERYALLKARPIAGDIEKGQRFLEKLSPFIYKRYLDFDMIDSLRQMKQGIARKARQKDYLNNIKLGPGGIREAEFIIQVLQLIHGGKIPALQLRSFIQALESLVEQGLLVESDAAVIKEAYWFLRKAENRLQEYQDQQTHMLPKQGQQRTQLALSLGFDDVDHFFTVLDAHRDVITDIFSAIFYVNSPDEKTHKNYAVLNLFWAEDSEENQASILDALADDYSDANAVLQLLLKFKTSTWSLLTERSQSVLQQLIPKVLQQCAQEKEDALTTLKRILTLLKSISRRPNYLSLLLELPIALEQAVFCCSQSAWLASQLARFPLLLDTLIDSRQSAVALDKKSFCRWLAAALQRIDRNDMEQFMECLRHFKHQQVFQIAVQSILHDLPVTETAKYLTELAESVVEKGLEFSFFEALEKDNLSQLPLADSGVCIIAYGKVGGHEMGYGSDIDFIFLYDPDYCVLEGAQLARLVRRFMHILSAYTPSGVLYEMDMRLRPEGKSGLLASTIDAFEAYQNNKAWVWEHQALIRARPIVGDARVAAKFEDIRTQVLSQERAVDSLRTEVLNMREKMRLQLDKSSAEFFDIKQGAGGLVDVEFVVQFFVLKCAANYPELLTRTSMLNLLEILEKYGVLSAEKVSLLTQAYNYYRSWLNKKNLQGEKALLEIEQKIDLESDFLSWLG